MAMQYLKQTLTYLNKHYGRGELESFAEDGAGGGYATVFVPTTQYTGFREQIRFTLADGFVRFRGKRRKVQRQPHCDFLRQDGETMREHLKKARDLIALKYRGVRYGLGLGLRPSEVMELQMEYWMRYFPDIHHTGIEGVVFRDSLHDGIIYLNMGDTYADTLLFRSDTERLWVGSYGDFVEKHPKLF